MNIFLRNFPAIMLYSVTTISTAQTICVFDPLGTQGDAYFFMKDYALEALQLHANITLKPYTDDQRASKDFKDGKCDGLSTVGIRAREFNNFTGSIDSAGGIPDEAAARSVLTLMANPTLAPEMRNLDTEVAGILPFGLAYPMLGDKSLNTLAKLNGKKVGILDYAASQRYIVDKVGAVSTSITLSTISNKFNTGQVDLIILPAIAFHAFELNKGMNSKGAITRYPLAYVTTQIIIHPAKFPDDYGQKSRMWVAGQLDHQLKAIKRIESGIDTRYWMDIPESDKLNYNKLFRQARISLENQGVYSKQMGGIMKKFGCQQNPASYECLLNDE